MSAGGNLPCGAHHATVTMTYQRRTCVEDKWHISTCQYKQSLNHLGKTMPPSLVVFTPSGSTRVNNYTPAVSVVAASVSVSVSRSASDVCDQVDAGDQVVPAHQVDDIDEVHELDPVLQVNHEDAKYSESKLVKPGDMGGGGET